jgi:hypothetical protein
MTRGRPEPVPLVSGLATVGLGVLLLADAQGWITLSMGWFTAALAAAVGLALMVSGLADRDR